MLSPTYITYLQHMGSTVTMREFHAKPGNKNLIALRHDVDHDLDMALEMSCWEHRQGIRSTYFILPDADYWKDSRLIDKCLQIQDFGHEIGLHLNVISEWFRGEADDPGLRLKEILEYLRSSGLNITGTAAHGDRLCYERQFINYWIFKELRPGDPLTFESGLTAEGIRAREHRFSIKYPDNHILHRDDGSHLPLWSVSMLDLGLDYHAIHVSHDRYFTDSGGSWKRSPDPLAHDLSTGRHQVLIHPEYWQGPQRMYFFLSTARSGSKWLTTMLDLATPLLARHEFSLNHRYKGGQLVREHVTGPGFVNLDQDKEQARMLLLDIRTWIEEQGQDFAEANIYLERFLPQLREVFPEAILVHLYRNPADVVRSIINRDWYETPEDDRHPVINIENWGRLSQFEKACWYVRAANENLMPLDAKLRFEEMVSHPDKLDKALQDLGIPFYPRLAEKYFNQKINRNKTEEFPEYARWPARIKKQYHAICAPVSERLGYIQLSRPGRWLMALKSLLSINKKAAKGLDACLARANSHNQPVCISKLRFAGLDSIKDISHKSCVLRQISQGLEAVPAADQHAYILFGGGEWVGEAGDSGWQPGPGCYYRGRIRVSIEGRGTARIFCLTYGPDNAQPDKKLLQVVKQGQDEYSISFRVRPNAVRFNLALHMSRDDAPEKLVLSAFELWMHPLEG